MEQLTIFGNALKLELFKEERTTHPGENGWEKRVELRNDIIFKCITQAFNALFAPSPLELIFEEASPCSEGTGDDEGKEAWCAGEGVKEVQTLLANYVWKCQKDGTWPKVPVTTLDLGELSNFYTHVLQKQQRAYLAAAAARWKEEMKAETNGPIERYGKPAPPMLRLEDAADDDGAVAEAAAWPDTATKEILSSPEAKEFFLLVQKPGYKAWVAWCEALIPIADAVPHRSNKELTKDAWQRLQTEGWSENTEKTQCEWDKGVFGTTGWRSTTLLAAPFPAVTAVAVGGGAIVVTLALIATVAKVAQVAKVALARRNL